MKNFYFILLVLISYGCQPKDELAFINLNKDTISKNHVVKKDNIKESLAENNKLSKLKITEVSKEEMISSLYKSFKSTLYNSKLIIKVPKDIKIATKPKQMISFDYNQINRNKILKSYNSYFINKNNISPLLISNYKNYNIKLIELLFGYPNYIRKENNVIIWQYKFNTCVTDFYYKEGQEIVVFSSMRSRNINLPINKKKCFLEAKKI